MEGGAVKKDRATPLKSKLKEMEKTQKDKHEYEESKDVGNAVCRGMISVLTPWTSITSSTATLTDPSQPLTYQSVSQGLKNELNKTGTKTHDRHTAGGQHIRFYQP